MRDIGRLSRLLESCTDIHLDRHILNLGLGHEDDGRLGLLLAKDHEFMITDEILKSVRNIVSPEEWVLLTSRMANGTFSMTTWQDLLVGPLSPRMDINLEKADDRFINSTVTEILKMSSLGDDIALDVLKRLLAHCKDFRFSEEVMFLAAEKEDCKILELLVTHGGGLTQYMLDNTADRVSTKSLDVFFDQGFQVTTKTLRKAIERPSWKSNAPLLKLLQRAEETGLTQEMSILLPALVESGYQKIEMIRQLLDRTGLSFITEEMTNLLVHATSARNTEELSILRLLLDRAENLHITEKVLISAARSDKSDSMLLLLDRAEIAVVTENVVKMSLATLDSGAALQTLAKSGKIMDTQDVLEAAASNWSCGAELVKSLLKRDSATAFPERAFGEAMRNPKQGMELFLALEEIFGPVEIDEDRLCTLLHKGGPREPLKQWLKPSNITNRVLIAALSTWPDYGIIPIVIKNSGHLDITLAALEAAAPVCPLNILRYLWTRGRLNAVPESLLVATVQRGQMLYDVFEFLLEQDEEIQVGERLLIAIAEKVYTSGRLFDSLIERDIAVTITQRVLKVAVTAQLSEISVKWDDSLIKRLLNRDPELKITNDLFQIAASNGRDDILFQFSKHSNLEKPPSEWQNIVGVYNATCNGDIRGLKDLLDSGVMPDTSNPQGRTPLTEAVARNHGTIVTMLLSAGASPDPVVNERTPLYDCALRDQHDLAKILVEAGASIEFTDKEGRTPEVFSMLEGKFKVSMYLKQCRKKREEAAKATSPLG